MSGFGTIVYSKAPGRTKMYAKRAMTPLILRYRALRMLAAVSPSLSVRASSTTLSDLPTKRSDRAASRKRVPGPSSVVDHGPAERSLVEETDKMMPESNRTRKPPESSQSSLLDEADRIYKKQAKEQSEMSPQESANSGNPLNHVPSNSISAPQTSVFNAFKVPTATASPDPGAFDSESFRIYREKLDGIVLRDPKFQRNHTAKPIRPETAAPVIEWLQENKTVVPYELSAMDRAWKEGVDELGETASPISDSFRKQLAEQQERFCQVTGFNAAQYKLASVGLARTARMFARGGVGLSANVIWEKIKEAGVHDKGILHTMLHVTSMYVISNRRGSRRYSFLVSILDSADGKDNTDESDCVGEEDKETVEEVAIFHDLLFEPTDQSLTARLRVLVSQGKAAEADRVLSKSSERLRLRACTPVLRLHLELGDSSSALRLFNRMRQMPLVVMDAETFIHLLGGLAEKGCFDTSAPAIDGAKELGYTVESGPELFDQIVLQMPQESIVDVSWAAARRLYNSFAEGFPESGLVKTSALLPLTSTVKEVTGNGLFAGVVSIDNSTGECPATGVTLRLLALEDDEKKKLRSSLLELARISQAEQDKKFKSRKRAMKVRRVKANERLQHFLHELDERSGEPFTAIVDGANVGYYLQNFGNGRFSFHQIKFVVDALEKMGELPLVVLPVKYTKHDGFLLPSNFQGTDEGRKQILTEEETQIKKELIQRGSVYTVSHGYLDDFYWISASIAEQTRSRNGKSLTVPTGNDEGRWPGARPILVSNDQMRDHRLGMMEPVLYRRWYSNHMVHYNFPPFIEGKCQNPEISFEAAVVFSREIQSNKAPDGSIAWHFPIDESVDEWLCIRIPRED